MLYGELSLCEEQTIFETSDNILEQIGEKVAKRYGDKYNKFIDKAVGNIQEYDAQLNLDPFLTQIELTKDDSSVELSKTKLTKIKKLPHIREISQGCNFDINSPYFEIDNGLIYKDGDTYRKSTIIYTVMAERLQRPIARMYKKEGPGQLEQIAVEMFEINDYMEKVNVKTYTYPSQYQGIFNLFIEDYKYGSREIEQYCLDPDLWKKTPLVQAFWKLYELKGVKVCKLVDIGINKELTPICLFTPESCKNLLLTLPEKYRGHPIIMSKKLTELLKSKGKKKKMGSNLSYIKTRKKNG